MFETIICISRSHRGGPQKADSTRNITHDSEKYAWKPPMDCFKEPNQYVIKMDIPGVNKNHLNLDLSGNKVIISGERRREKNVRFQRDYRKEERKFDTFDRILKFPGNIQSQETKATYNNGVLEIKIDRPESTKRHEIEIN